MITPPLNNSEDTEKMKTLGKMASAMAHEINNPLSIIRSKTTLLSMKLEREEISKEELTKYLSDIDVTALRIERIVKSLVYFSKDIKPELSQTITPRQLHDHILSFIRSTLTEKRVTFSLKDNSGPAAFKGNLHQIVQVFLNLLSLSIEGLEDTEKKEIIFESKVEDNQLMILIRTTGSTDHKNDLNLSLTLSKGIVENHLGSLQLSISPQGETIYQLLFPLY